MKMKLVKVKKADDEVSASRRYVQQMSNNLGSVSRNATFILGQMQSWPNKNDRIDIGLSLQHLAETAQDTTATLLKTAKQLMK